MGNSIELVVVDETISLFFRRLLLFSEEVNVSSQHMNILIHVLFLINKSITLHVSIENKVLQKHKHLLNDEQALSTNTFSLKKYGGKFRTSLFPHKLSILKTTRTKVLTNFPDFVPKSTVFY